MSLLLEQVDEREILLCILIFTQFRAGRSIHMSLLFENNHDSEWLMGNANDIELNSYSQELIGKVGFTVGLPELFFPRTVNRKACTLIQTPYARAGVSKLQPAKRFHPAHNIFCFYFWGVNLIMFNIFHSL